MLPRRDFIRQTGILATASAFGLPAFGLPKAKKFKMGLQLFTVRDAMAKDAGGTLKKAAAMGYEDLETYGYGADQNTYYGFKAADFKSFLQDNKLTATSGHYDFAPLFNKPADELYAYVDKCIIGAHAIGQRYITWPWLSPDNRSPDHFKLLAQKLNGIGERVNKAGLGFAYHNHDFEFTDHNGQNGYTIVMNETDASLVKLQMDLYWVMHSSKLTPLELFKLQPGRFVMWHIKDMDRVTRDYTELGNGTIDFSTILPHYKLAGLQYYFVEQGSNFKTNSMQSITDCADYMKKNLLKYLE